jgi:hypothetical protein
MKTILNIKKRFKNCLIVDNFIFCIFKSDHLELRNTLPNDENVVRILLLRSKNTLKYDR